MTEPSETPLSVKWAQMIRWPDPVGVRILARLIEKERFDRKVAEAVGCRGGRKDGARCQRVTTAAQDRKPGPYRHDVIEATGVYVSTIYRESSAMEYASPYFETMAFWLPGREPENGRPIILWQSAGGFEREADHQHDLAVRWFSREGVRFL